MNEKKDLGDAYQFFLDCDYQLKKNRNCSIPLLNKLIQLYIDAGRSETILCSNDICFRARIYNEKDKVERYINPPSGDFKGYDERNSFIPPAGKTYSEGRCNEKNEQILYVANSEECCIHEINAPYNSYVSIAEIKMLSPLIIADMNQTSAMTNYDDSIVPGIIDSTMLVYLYNFFSRKSENEMDYRLTQYISKRIKQQGYDGISFFSSIYKGEKNVNYAIFNFEKCKAVNSRLVYIDEKGNLEE